MLHILQSNRMEILAAQLSALMHSTPKNNPFTHIPVLVQSPGMSQWLKQSLAHTLGVCANVEFPLPSSFIWRLYQQALPNVPDESAFNKDNLTWKLFELLPTKLEHSAYQSLAQYLQNDEDGSKRLALCEKIADVFDHYLMYRPDWIAAWEQGEDQLADVDMQDALWQSDLWRTVVAHAEKIEQSHYHRANMHSQLLSAIEQAQVKVPDRIYVFGISALPHSQLELINALAKQTDIFIFLHNPSEHYWGDIVDEKTQAKIKLKFTKKPNLEREDNHFIVGNPLLSSWGKLGRDYLEQLVELDAQWHDAFDTEFAPSLLGHIQQQIYDLSFKGQSLCSDTSWYLGDEGKVAISENDHSMRFVDCHSALREVEQLHDHLLREFNRDPSLTPKDIIVMMPDVGKYSPFIDAVFGSAKGERYIPYAISDRSIAQERPLVNALVSLAHLPQSRFGVSELMELLYIEPIAARFELSQNELVQCHHWLEQVQVKWGLDGEHKSQFNLPNIELNTWRLGLQRLLLGVAQTDAPYNGIYPCDAVEGMASDTLSKLIAFIEALTAAKRALSEQDTLANKVVTMRQCISEVIDVQQLSSGDLVLLDTLLENIEKHDHNGDYHGPVSSAVFAYLIEQGTQQTGVGQRFLIGRVNICTLMPMRAVPFKKVCLLGLNDGEYPRNVQPIGFDLVAKGHRRKGDRSRRLDDRYLFLEALLSARDSVYLSYIGRSSRDNSPRMPCVLVNELMHYVDSSFVIEDSNKAPSKQLTEQHHLQPFNAQYYSEQHPWQSFNPTWALTTSAMSTLQGTEPQSAQMISDDTNVIELPMLLKCAKHPQRFFYQQVLSARLDEVEALEEDNEYFMLDSLNQYQLLDELLHTKVAGETLEHEAIVQRGVLPQGVLTQLQLDKLYQRVDPLFAQIQLHTQGELGEPVEVYIESEHGTLQGWLNDIYGASQVFYRAASIKPKDRLAGFIYHLTAQIACNDAITTWVLGLDNAIAFEPMERDEAMGHLVHWLNLYQQSLIAPQPFFAQSAWEYVTKQSIDKANAKFANAGVKAPSEQSDVYISMDFNNLFEVEDEFIRYADNLLKPITELAKEHSYANA